MVDPSDGAPFASIARGTSGDVDLAVRAAQSAREGPWGRLSPAERGRALMAISQAILANAEALALVEARDCGKPMKQARADVDRRHVLSRRRADTDRGAQARRGHRDVV